MTGNTQELDEVSQLLGIYLSEIDVDGSMPTSITRQDLERILSWHNKQVEAVLDRLEQSHYTIAMRTDGTGEVSIIDVAAIEAERIRLRGGDDK